MSLPNRTYPTNPYAPTHGNGMHLASPPLSSTSTSKPYIFDRRNTSSSYGFPSTSHSGIDGPQRINSFSSTSGIGMGIGGSGSGSGNLKLGQLVKRLFKFPQMDFELAGWEILNLMVAPRRAWRGVWYRRQTKTTPTPSDPALVYLLSGFLFLTSLAWSLAYANPSFGNIMRIAFYFVLIHFLGFSALSATVGWLFVGKALGPGGWAVKFGNTGVGSGGGSGGSGSGSGGVMGRLGGVVRGRRRGLFADLDGPGGGIDGKEGLSWGFAFEIAIRSFVPTWVYLYVIQFLLLPVVASKHWPSTLLTNTLHLLSISHSTYITFLGYNSIPSLSATHLLLIPQIALFVFLYVVLTLSGWNASLHFAPVLWCWGGLRGVVGGAGAASSSAAAGAVVGGVDAVKKVASGAGAGGTKRPPAGLGGLGDTAGVGTGRGKAAGGGGR